MPMRAGASLGGGGLQCLEFRTEAPRVPHEATKFLAGLKPHLARGLEALLHMVKKKPFATCGFRP